MPGPDTTDLLAESARVLRDQGAVALCQIVRIEGSTPGKVGWKMLVRPDGSAGGNLGGGAFEALVEVDARQLLERRSREPKVKRYYLTETAVRGEPTGMVCGGLIEVLIEVLMQQPVLVICGGGPVGQALARAAALCSLDILLAEDRKEYRQPSLFPPGTVFSPVDRDYEEAFLEPFLQREILAAVVTRCWETDLAAMTSILRQAPPHLSYLGLMGSERKIERVRESLLKRGLETSGLPFFAPIGLALGGNLPAEIAVAVLAEIIQVRAAEKQGENLPHLEYARQSG
ncbi:MAG: XdhC/CoxI family protein [Acidobacteriota bacterium]|nr:XdhC/CoxI family protein [Acidobacteriota bacterium]